jgi:hypothetical protein
MSHVPSVRGRGPAELQISSLSGFFSPHHHTTTHQKCEGSAKSESAGAEFTAADA